MSTDDDEIPRDGGWTFRFTASGPRLDEAVQNYRDLGFEIRVEPSAPLAADAGGPGCGEGCCTSVDGPVMAIFTRPARSDAEEELFDSSGDDA